MIVFLCAFIWFALGFFKALSPSNEATNSNPETTPVPSNPGSETQSQSDVAVRRPNAASSSTTLSETDVKRDLELKPGTDNTPSPLFPLLIRNLARKITAEFLQEMFKQSKSVQYVWVFKSEFLHRVTERAVVVFRDEEERADAIQKFQIPWTCAAQNGNTMYWAVEPSSLYDQATLKSTPRWRYDQKLRFDSSKPDEERHQLARFWGRHTDDTIEPGLILMLPTYEERRPEFYVDPRICPKAYGHPVIVVQEFGDGFWNIVICTSSPKRGWDEDDAIKHWYLQIEWGSSPHEGEEVLTLARDKRGFISHSYAGTTAYTVEINALVRLWRSTNTPWRWKIANLELLKSRIRDVGFLYEPGDARGHPSYFGGTIDKKRAPRVGVLCEVNIGLKNNNSLVSEAVKGVDNTEDPAEPNIDKPLVVCSRMAHLFGECR